MDLSIERFDLAKDDVDRAAWLIYISDPDIMSLFFGRQQEAIPMLADLIRMENTHFSYRYILCAKYNGHIVGILVGFDGKQGREIERACGQEYLRAMGFIKAIRAGLVALFMTWLIKKRVDDHEFYVNNLCVAPDNRSLGIGSALLNEVFKKHNVVSLDVNINNPRGLSFYQRNDFRIKIKRKIKLMGRMLGKYNMIWTRKGNCYGSG
ncbi:MAG: hypothetical protein DDT40_00247 [candidate division WS2 bacterium]|uniref:N-acetyltransferase domain-containing protein n=1 Tax=Psychracetigena formicireducens TaxID=2986056 RepID=A0A9E2BJV0_PSYF1|nr:hypothetical protein [Candidatus Psychracetigena formicireducens]MBT9144429.1 hypothetical protein [Candidatus Psychracetigena formicireducens]MBT9150081.1 hypothetical protein [Candidatus Psychracetigena formicireducens]